MAVANIGASVTITNSPDADNILVGVITPSFQAVSITKHDGSNGYRARTAGDRTNQLIPQRRVHLGSCYVDCLRES